MDSETHETEHAAGGGDASKPGLGLGRVLKWVAIAVVGFIVVVALTLAWLVNSPADLSAYEDAYAPAADNGVTVRFFGTSSMLFSDGETNIMIDGWFSRPSLGSTAFGMVEPDIPAIEAGLAKLGNPKVAALIPAHSHYDHAMDVAEVAKRTSALLVGSESTANIGRGGGLPEDQIKVVEDGESLIFGDFTVTMIDSKHFVFPESSALAGIDGDWTIDEPLTPPAPAREYMQGVAYSILIEHSEGSALIQSSAGFKEDSLEGIDVDVVYLGIGGLTGQTDDYLDTYWREIVAMTEPEGIYVIHWDSFFDLIADLERPAPPNRLMNEVLGFGAGTGIAWTMDRGDEAGINVRLLPMWAPVDAFGVGDEAPSP